jgi:hypothetical protein
MLILTLRFLHLVEERSIADVSEVHSSSICRVEVNMGGCVRHEYDLV